MINISNIFKLLLITAAVAQKEREPFYKQHNEEIFNFIDNFPDFSGMPQEHLNKLKKDIRSADTASFLFERECMNEPSIECLKAIKTVDELHKQYAFLFKYITILNDEHELNADNNQRTEEHTSERFRLFSKGCNNLDEKCRGDSALNYAR